VFVVGRAGEFKNLTLGLDGTNPRFPWKPSATMLIYRLTGTTEASGSTTTNATSLRPSERRQQEQPAPNLRPPRCASKTAPHCWSANVVKPAWVFTHASNPRIALQPEAFGLS